MNLCIFKSFSLSTGNGVYFIELKAGAPVSCYLYVKSHLDIEQVLILPQVLSHLALQAPQLGIQVADGVLLTWERDRTQAFSIRHFHKIFINNVHSPWWVFLCHK